MLRCAPVQTSQEAHTASVAYARRQSMDPTAYLILAVSSFIAALTGFLSELRKWKR